MHSIKFILGLGVLSLVTGCSTTLDNRRLIDPEDSFGHSVRHMIRTQTYDPFAAAVPASGGLDGDKAAMALKTYRTDKSAAAAGSKPVNISIGE